MSSIFGLTDGESGATLATETDEREEYIGPHLTKRAVGGASTAERDPMEWTREGEPNDRDLSSRGDGMTDRYQTVGT